MSYQPKAGIIETDLNTEMVLLDPSNQRMFSLNEVGRLIWKGLPTQGLEATLTRITAEYGVSEEQARADALELVEELVKAGLLQAK